MKPENLQQFLNTRVKILVNVGQPTPFRYMGFIVSIDGDDFLFDDCRQGKMAFSCSSIVGISQEAQ